MATIDIENRLRKRAAEALTVDDVELWMGLWDNDRIDIYGRSREDQNFVNVTWPKICAAARAHLEELPNKEKFVGQEALTVGELDECERDYQLEHIDTGVRSGRLPAICTAARAHIEGGWRPIETAPKDVRVIVWDGKTVHVARWAAKYNCFVPLDSAWNITPTHWQSLPRPPE